MRDVSISLLFFSSFQCVCARTCVLYMHVCVFFWCVGLSALETGCVSFYCVCVFCVFLRVSMNIFIYFLFVCVLVYLWLVGCLGFMAYQPL